MAFMVRNGFGKDSFDRFLLSTYDIPLRDVVGELCARVKSALGSGSLLRPLSSSEFTQGIPSVGGGQGVVLSSPAVGLCKDQDTGGCCS